MTLIDKAEAHDDRTPERRRIDTWSAENPRDRMALIAVAAWLNTTPDKLPKEMRLHTCAATKEAWARVVDAIRALPARGVGVKQGDCPYSFDEKDCCGGYCGMEEQHTGHPPALAPTDAAQAREAALWEAWNVVWEAKTLLDAKNALHALIGEPRT